MADSVEIDVEGAERLAATMRRAEGDLRDFADTNRAIAELNATKAREYAPKKSGALSRSIVAKGEATRAVITSPLNYARIQEYGHRARNISPRLYMTRAVEDQTNRALAIAEKGVQRDLNKVKGA